MYKIKLISFTIIIILILNFFIPIISNANNEINKTNTDNEINNEIKENIIEENTVEKDTSNIEDNNINNNIQNNIIDNSVNSTVNNELSNTIENNNVTDEKLNNSINNTITNNVITNKVTENNILNKESNNNLTYDIDENDSKDMMNTYKLKASTIGIKYSSHVQDIGWQNYVENGKSSGTTGRNLKIEAIKISLINNPSNIKIKYCSYAKGKGWLNTMENDKISGTTGQNRKMEAIKIWLEGTNEYSVMYRTHIQDFGWQEWCYDGCISGKLGDDKKIEAIEIKIVPKTQTKMSINYSSHVQDIGWQSAKEEHDISGTTGRNLKIEALKLSLKNAPKGVSVKYTTYIENSGWQSWAKDGQISGTTGKNKKVYGIRIELVGTTEYTIQYRAHVQDNGWTTWKKNGDIVGNITQNKKIEAIQIRIIKEKRETRKIGVEYYTYLQGFSWNENKMESNGEISGTQGENRKVEAIQIELKNAPADAHIKYKTHIQDTGWVDWSKDGKISGILNKNLKIEAIKIELEGLKDYTVEYRTHVQDIGWTAWYIDGETSGTTGKNKKIEAIQIRIVPKYRRYFKGIDVSVWQKEIDYDKLAKSGQVDFIIARIGWYSESRKQLMVDTQFERNYKESKRKNIPLGAYFYSYATSIESAKLEAEAVVKYLKASGLKDYSLPIFYDIEDNSQIRLGKDIITQMSITFCETLKKAGFNVGVYSYSHWLENYMDLSKLPSDYSKWVANYPAEDDGSLPSNVYKFSEKYDMWQYSSSGSIQGIDGKIDMNICYRRYF